MQEYLNTSTPAFVSFYANIQLPYTRNSVFANVTNK